ncbi:hypothetical protein CA606_11795 [Caulobacter vibrioides]|uniref:Haem-binding uptake Tiki superfamily ChaN domain-containing protein n=1 Tax=Caulobacter vibrioides TaxID=155892 RepID=A0A290MLL5_CAUVI|nr:ChaN family lipoprotein [Caulobacter vibrioides]ATC32957.1 hypothetical protein CA606_11795 [Caulobacter vibrioides]
MPKASRSPRAVRASLAALAALTFAAPAALAQPAPSLKAVGDRHQLSQGLADFYDTAFVLKDVRTGQPRVASFAEMAKMLSTYDVVFFGESHRHPGVHLQQQRLFRALVERHPRYILSLEQFERDTQPVLDAYLAGKVGENALKEKGRAWDNYPTAYRPLVEYARTRGLHVIAAEAPTWAVVCIGQWGPEILARFTPEERAWVARDLNPGTGAYRAKYMRFQAGAAAHGGGASQSPEALLKAERSLAGQTARDDTMAESIHLALKAHPGSKVLHLNGNFHSAGFLGTVERLKLRDPALKIAVIDPLEVEDPKAPSLKTADLENGSVLQLVYPNPPTFAPGEDMSEWVRALMSKRKASVCKYAPQPASPPGGEPTKP